MRADYGVVHVFVQCAERLVSAFKSLRADQHQGVEREVATWLARSHNRARLVQRCQGEKLREGLVFKRRDVVVREIAGHVRV